MAVDVTPFEHLDAALGDPPGARAALGLICLATDRVGEVDFREFAAGLDGVETFVTRVPMDPDVTPASLAAMGDHLEHATTTLVPGSDVEVVAYSCTSGTIAIGEDAVARRIRAVRPGVAVTTPPRAAANGLRLLGASRIAVITPYRDDVNTMIAGYLRGNGFSIEAARSFKLAGDPQMNRVRADDLLAVGTEIGASACDAVFISCTGLRTRYIVEQLEARIGKPVVTSNQALAWEALRLAGIDDRLPDRGSLFRA